MQVEYINPFIISAIEIFEKVAKIELKKSNLTVKKGTTPENEISIVIGLSGDFMGQVVYSFKRHTAQRVVSCMMPNASADKQMAYMESAISSMANMITGRATILLAGKEKIIYITPPTVAISAKTEMKYSDIPTLSTEFTSRFGTLQINVAIRPK
ncbi:MAG: chemotaxis protein CheX [Spirochaetes bacterium]|nr:chemotaxis protein CheX [Spirochaetota bacterium]